MRGAPRRAQRGAARCPGAHRPGPCGGPAPSSGARPPRGRRGRTEHSPEGPAVRGRLVPHDGEHGGQHAEEQHEQQRGQVEVVGPARRRQPGTELARGQAPATYARRMKTRGRETRHQAWLRVRRHPRDREPQRTEGAAGSAVSAPRARASPHRPVVPDLGAVTLLCSLPAASPWAPEGARFRPGRCPPGSLRLSESVGGRGLRGGRGPGPLPGGGALGCWRGAGNPARGAPCTRQVLRVTRMWSRSPGRPEHLLVGHVAGEHSPAPQVHEPDQFEDVEGRETRGEEGPHPGTQREASERAFSPVRRGSETRGPTPCAYRTGEAPPEGLSPDLPLPPESSQGPAVKYPLSSSPH